MIDKYENQFEKYENQNVLYGFLIFSALYFLIIPTQYAKYAFGIFVLIFALFLLRHFFGQVLEIRNWYVIAVAVPYFLFLVFSSTDHTNTILRWMVIVLIFIYESSLSCIEYKTYLEKLIWGVILLFFLLNFFFRNYTYLDEFILWGAMNDHNISFLVVFLFFLYGEKRKLPGGKLIVIYSLLFLSNSRSFILLIGVYYFLKLIKIVLPERLISRDYYFRKNIVFWILIALTVITVLFSFYWYFSYSALNTVSAHRDSLNDGSNRWRALSNIYAVLQYICKIDIQSLLVGTGDSYEGILSYNYFGGIVGQSHNSVLNILVKFGTIPGIIYIWILSKIISRHMTLENIEFILPFIINSMIVHCFYPGVLLFWLLVIIIPKEESGIVTIFKS